jgi:hypothetical protein
MLDIVVGKNKKCISMDDVDIILSLFLIGVNIWGTILYADTNSNICDGSLLTLAATNLVIVWICVAGPLLLYLFEKFKLKCVYRKQPVEVAGN